MPDRTVVCDTTVLLYLGRIDQVELLQALFSTVYIPEQVLTELDMGRLLRRDTWDPRDYDWVNLVSVSQSVIDRLPSNRLGLGERAVIAFARAQRCDVVGLDDLQARTLATQLGLEVIGTLGILVLAKRRGLIPGVRQLLDAVVDQGFHLDQDLYGDVLKLAGELD